MAIALYRLGRWCATHGWRVVAGWLVVLLALGALAGTISTPRTEVVEIPHAKFVSVLHHLQQRVPGVTGNLATAVFASDDGSALTPRQRAAVSDVVASWKRIDHVTTTVDPFRTQRRLDATDDRLAAARKKLSRAQTKVLAGAMNLSTARKYDLLDPAQLRAAQRRLDAGRVKVEEARVQLDRATKIRTAAAGVRFVSADGSTAISQIGFDLDPQSLSATDREAVVAAADRLNEVGVSADFGTEITHESSVVGPGEIAGLAIAGVVLLLLLGSLIAAGLPLLVSIVGVAVGLSAAVASTYFYSMHSMAPALALMLGLAVGIDYLLFILTRHRSQLLGGMPMAESIGRAVGTAGNAVVFAGSTVVVALVALTMSGIPILAQMGLVAAGAVVSAVLMSITLGPALLGLVGHRIASRRAWRRVRDEDGRARVTTHGGWWVRVVTVRPWLTVAFVLGAVALLAYPATNLRLGLPDGSSEDPGSSARTAYSEIAQQFGPGMNGPVLVTADLAPGTTKAQSDVTAAVIDEDLAMAPGVASVLPIGSSADHRTLAWQVVLTTGPTDERTAQTVHALLDVAPQIGERNGAEMGLTGRTVANIEISERLSSALPAYLLVVVGLSLLILIGVFRSVIVPLIATGGFLLSVAAAFGALVAVYQWGWLGSLFNVHTPGPLMSFGPILLIGVLFGLAMDYQMFLVSGMREAYAHGSSPRDAVRTGFMSGAQVVTAAAGIMFAVFGGFVFSEMVMIRPIGFGLAVGVAVDAFLVRMTLTPALMHLLGEKAWWIPRWLDRILPDLDVEGAHLADRLAAEQAPASAGRRELERV
jgi:RND superfamily putative drug exporter